VCCNAYSAKVQLLTPARRRVRRRVCRKRKDRRPCNESRRVCKNTPCLKIGICNINDPFAKELQPDFVDPIPISVYVSAGKVPIKVPRGVVFKDLAQIGIS